jgi:iron complex outermembrane receptor protein
MLARAHTNPVALATGLAIGMVGFSVGTAQAQAAGEGVGEVEAVIVTAQRRSENIQQVPIAIQALTSQSLREKGVGQVQDLQKVAANVTITSPLGAGSAPDISIRGIGLNDFNTNNSGPNGVYVDEFAVSSPNAQGLSFFDLERVEVLKGPQGTLYGRNASGGAINVITAKPSQTLKAMGRLSYSSYRTIDAEAAVGGGLTDTLSGRLSGMYKYSRGYMYNHVYDRHENGANLWGVRGQLQWEPTDDLTALLKVQAVRNNTRATMYKHFGALDPSTGDLCSVADTLGNNCADLFGYAGRKGFYEGDWNNGDKKSRVTDYNSTLRLEYDLPAGLNLVSVTGTNHNRRFHPEQSDAAPQRSLEIDYGTLSQEFTQEVRLSATTDRSNWVVGGFYIHEKIKQDQPLDVLLDLDVLLGPGGSDGVAFRQQTRNTQRTEAEALFGQYEFKATDQLSVFAGARYNRERRSFASFSSTEFQEGGADHLGAPTLVSAVRKRLSNENFSYRVGANYKFTPDVMAYATVATGFKSGGFNGGFLSQDPAQRSLQLDPFKPEKVTAYEIGLKSQMFERRLMFNVSAFYNDYKNQQVSVLVQTPIGPLFALDNAQKAEIYGLEADTTFRVTPNLTLSAQAGYLHTELTEFVANLDPTQPDYSGNRLSLAPKLTTALTADYKREIGPGELGLQFSSTYRSKQFFEPSNSPYLFQNGYWLHNARVSYSFDEGRYEIAAFARNLTKKKYLIWNAALFEPFGVATGTVGEPRFVGVELNLKY